MQYKVPQNIDMEDKIIGPLTLTQFFYLLFGGLTLFILFKDLTPLGLFPLFVILSIPIGVITLAFAFVKIQNRPFSVFFMSAVKFMFKPKQRIWQHTIEPVKQHTPPPQPVVQKVESKKNLDLGKINEVADILDKGGDDSEGKPGS